MDNLTHSLVGLSLAKTGLERLSPGATTLCILAANSPDIDVGVLVLRGRWEYLQHHRGITHSIVGVCFLTVALPLVFYLVDRLIAHFRTRPPQVKLPGLLLASAIATVTHPFLDWTNNYGIRPLLPWDSTWFYGDFAFVVDPYFWMVLGGTGFLLTATTKPRIFVWFVLALLPTYLVAMGSAGPNRLANANALRLFWLATVVLVIAAYHLEFRKRYGARLAKAALVVISIYCAALALTHVVALQRARAQAAGIAVGQGERVVRVVAMPIVANPTAWLCLLETERATYKFDLSVIGDGSAINVARFAKPTGRAAELVAEAKPDARAQIFLGFARFPGFRVTDESCVTQALVQFADLRYTEPGKGRGTFSLEVPVECPPEIK
jgi:inner membrane protein